MTSTLDLLEQVQKKSEERQESLTKVNQNALKKLSESIQESLSESESTIKTDITKNEDLIKTQITTSSQNIITQVEETETEITKALSSLRKAIRSFLSHWLAVALIAFVIFAFGMFIGVGLTKLTNKQDYPTYKYYLDKTNGQSYMIPLED